MPDDPHDIKSPGHGRGVVAPFDVPWRIRDALLVILWTFLALIGCLLLLGFGIGVWLGAQRIDTGPEFWQRVFLTPPAVELLILLQLLLTGLFLSARLFRPHRVRLNTLFLPGRAKEDARLAAALFLKCFAILLAVVVGIVSLLLVVGLLMRRDMGGAVSAYTEGMSREGKQALVIGMPVGVSPLWSWLRVGLVTLVVPPVEELLFRGGLYAALRKRFVPWQANLMSSVVFALTHSYVFAFPNVLIVGILSAYAYERSRSLRASVFFHAFCNLYASTSVQPVLWLALVGGLAAALRGRRAAPVSEAAADLSRLMPRRTGWKIYAWILVVLWLMSVDTLAETWQLLIVMPACAAVFLYAYRKPSAPRSWWIVYGIIYAGWMLAGLTGLSRPEEMKDLYAATVEQGFPVTLANALALVLIGLLAVALSLALIVIWRLAQRSPAR